MLKLAVKLPKNIYVAVSGGPDSMAALGFLRTHHNVTILHFNHGTMHGRVAEDFVRTYAARNNIPILVGYLNGEMEKGRSKENFWREERYNFFSNVKDTIVLAHNLDDAMETWVFSSFHGLGKLIPMKRDNFVRPFILTRKLDLKNWCDTHSIPYVIDGANNDEAYARIKIRKLMPELLKINPGLAKTVRKKYLNQLMETNAR